MTHCINHSRVDRLAQCHSVRIFISPFPMYRLHTKQRQFLRLVGFHKAPFLITCLPLEFW